jgi:hypothetical protein
VIVDADGRFVGNVGPGMQLNVPRAEGHQVYYAWSSHDLRVEREPNFDPVSAVRVDVHPGRVHYVTLIVQVRSAYVSRCNPWALVDLHYLPTSGPRRDEAEAWVRDGRWISPDSSAGQAEFDAAPARLASFLELGREKMRRIDDERARGARRPSAPKGRARGGKRPALLRKSRGP